MFILFLYTNTATTQNNSVCVHVLNIKVKIKNKFHEVWWWKFTLMVGYFCGYKVLKYIYMGKHLQVQTFFTIKGRSQVSS